VSTGHWQGALNLGAWPCPGSCNGGFAGTLAGSTTGTDTGGHPFVVVWPDPTAVSVPVNFSATFNYTDPCLTPAGGLGNALGTFTLAGGYVDDNGAISHDGTLSGQFNWSGTGLVVVVTTGGGVLTGGGQTLATQQNAGTGAGTFVPTSVPGTCFGEQPMTAQVVGSYGNPP
jgi:hypothetical protein